MLESSKAYSGFAVDDLDEAPSSTARHSDLKTAVRRRAS